MSDDRSMELFPERKTRRVDPRAPLADRMRPRSFDELVGQEALLAPRSALRALIDSGELQSLILWGPPGSGKTTLARLLAEMPDTRLEEISAVVAGVKEIRAVVEQARRVAPRTLLFVDEIHRLNRAQQDVLLPHVEAGVVVLVGATTENPSFTVNAPLLSRCRVLQLEALSKKDIEALLRRASADEERGLGRSGLQLSDEAVRTIAEVCDGDARRALGLLESAASVHLASEQRRDPLAAECVREVAGRRVLIHDRDREEHFNVVSALIKSLRASDPDAALYYLARMLAAGEDPLFPARRLVIFASEDVGNADPAALGLATSTYLAVERLGMPEARIPLAQATTYLACAPKSNAAYAGLGAAQRAIEATGSPPVPLHLRNAPTGLMKDLGYGRDYRYPHDEEDAFVAAENLPEALAGSLFYQPTERGAEAELGRRLRALRERRARAVKGGSAPETDPEGSEA